LFVTIIPAGRAVNFNLRAFRGPRRAAPRRPTIFPLSAAAPMVFNAWDGIWGTITRELLMNLPFTTRDEDWEGERPIRMIQASRI